jgi:CRISPR-associated protein (Cas_Cas02710)
MTDKTYPLLILLVGSNPLPNYLSACALKPSRIALVHSKETEGACRRLKHALENALSGVAIEPCFVEEATSAEKVQRAIDPLLQTGQSVWLNYTGGTKVMAVHACMAFHSVYADGGKKCASYLDEGGRGQDPRLRFDDGTSKLLSECEPVPLNLATLLALHGYMHTPRQPRGPAPLAEDAREILHKVLADVPLAKLLYCESEGLKEFERNPSRATEEPFRAERHGLMLSQALLPTKEALQTLANSDEKRSWFKHWCDFLGGGWLEDWLAAQIRSLELQPASKIEVGVRSFRSPKQDFEVGVRSFPNPKQDFEVDVAVVRGHRSYFISCTTDATKALCKSKLLEIAVRSRQLGGDLARAALVCLFSDTAKLQQEINDVWGASNTTKVFGLSDVRDWSDIDGKQPNLTALKAWLES